MVFLRISLAVLTCGAIVAACGSRTDLPTGTVAGTTEEASTDATLDQRDGDARRDGERPFDGPLFEGGPLDVTTDCDAGPTCSDADPGFIYRCGVRVFQCSSLERCREGQCVNPCLDTLGQDTSNGCEFFAVQMDAVPEAEGVCFAVFVVNQWESGEPARIEVARSGTTLPIEQFTRIPVGTGQNITYAPYNAAQGLAKDQVAVMFLSRDPAAAGDGNPSAPRRLAGCPAGVTPAVVGDAAIHGTGRGRAFHIKTNVPVVAYQMLPFGAGRARVTGATLLLPTNVWEDNYVAVNAYAAPTLFTAPRAGPTLAIVSQEDGTVVRVRPTVAVVAGPGVQGTSANVATSYTLARGEYLQFTQPEELTGSAIQATRPVAVIGGSTLMDIPLSRVRADGAHQMLPPVRALGSEYVGVRYRGRRQPDGTLENEPVPWRIVGVADGTQLTFTPALPGAPTSVNARELREWNATGPFVVRSQDAAHPFYFAQYMTGGEPFSGEGDPEFVNVIPPQQFLPRYTLFTDPTYPETELVLVRQRVATEGGLAFPDVSLDCSGLVTGWQNIGAYQTARVSLSTGNFQGVGGCDNGVHRLTASVQGAPLTGPAFGVTVWGWGSRLTYSGTNEADPAFTRWVSYGYPGGANITRLNNVILSAQ